jgi:hypothetical protein
MRAQLGATLAAIAIGCGTPRGSPAPRTTVAVETVAPTHASALRLPHFDGQIGWPALRTWLMQLPAESIPHRAHASCDPPRDATSYPLADALGASIVASYERGEPYFDDRTIERGCPPALREVGVATGITVPGLFASWVLRFDADDRLVSVDEEDADAQCALDASTLEAMLATEAVVDLYHRSMWDPNDDPELAREPRLPRFSTGQDARRVVYEVLAESGTVHPCEREPIGCTDAWFGGTSGTEDTQLYVRADGSVAFITHIDAGAPTTTIDELDPWSMAERARFATLLTSPVDESQLPRHDDYTGRGR